MIMLTGGAGLLGQELQKHIECVAPNREEFDIAGKIPYYLSDDVHMIVHCAAYTDVVKAEEDRNACWLTNVNGTKHVSRLGVPVVYISTEYVFSGGVGNYSEKDIPNPQNFYALTKLCGELALGNAPTSLTIRCLFKPRPFEHEYACTDQWTSGDYVDVIAPLIAKAILLYEKDVIRHSFRCVADLGHDIVHIGTGRKSTYDLAKQSNPDVKPCLRSDIKSVKLPMDTSLDTTQWETKW